MGSSPKPPDPYAQAQAQNQQNAYAAQYNNISANANQYTPYGTVINAPGQKIPIYNDKGKITGYADQWNQTTTLSPMQQKIFDAENQAKLGLGTFATKQIGQLTDVLGKPFNTSGLNPWQTYGAGPDLQYEKSATDRAAIEKAMMDSYRRGVAPGQSAEDAQMAARGQSPGGQMDYTMRQGRNDAASEAARQAYLGSGQESRTAMEAVNKALQQNWLNANTRVDQGNAVRQGQFGERQQTRNQLVNEIAALMGGGQATVPQAQAFNGATVNPFDIAGAQNNAYNIQSQNYANKMNGIFGLGGNLLKMFNPFSMFGAGTGMFGR